MRKEKNNNEAKITIYRIFKKCTLVPRLHMHQLSPSPLLTEENEMELELIKEEPRVGE